MTQTYTGRLKNEQEKLPVAIEHISVSGIEKLLPRLRNKVFHATSLTHYRQILNDGALTPNPGDRSSPFGDRPNGYFRNRHCVSFFDYRQHRSRNWKTHASACWPTYPHSQEEYIVILFLREEFYSALIGWEVCVGNLGSQQIVPFVECGFQGEVQLSHTHEHLLVQSSEHNARKFNEFLEKHAVWAPHLRKQCFD